MENEEENELNEEDILEVIEVNDEHAIASDEEFEAENGLRAEDNVAERMLTADIPNDDSILTFSKHTGSVFAVDAGPNNLVVSGGEDDRAYVWRWTTGEVLFECKDHEDSVVNVKFNSKKSLFATADMSGIVQVWTSDDFRKVQRFHIGDLEWLSWHHNADILFCGDHDGSVWMWLVNTTNCKVYPGHGPSCSAGVPFPDGKRLCVGYEDGNVKIWDLKEATTISVYGASCHTESITCVDCHPDNNIAASGSEDGTVNLFQSSNGKIVESIGCAKRTREVKEDEDENVESISVETLAFSPNAPLLSIGTVIGDLILWDMNSSTVREKLRHPDGVVKSAWLEHCVMTACLDGVLRLWDSRSGATVREWNGHGREILDFSFTPDLQNVITASADERCKVFSIKTSSEDR